MALDMDVFYSVTYATENRHEIWNLACQMSL